MELIQLFCSRRALHNDYVDGDDCVVNDNVTEDDDGNDDKNGSSDENERRSTIPFVNVVLKQLNPESGAKPKNCWRDKEINFADIKGHVSLLKGAVKR